VKTEYQFIRFDIVPGLEQRKTRVYVCRNNRHETYLGKVSWDGQWRQYCFSPGTETIFSAGCLADIQHFIGQLMDDRRGETKTMEVNRQF
jgi:hypothetical protein